MKEETLEWMGDDWIRTVSGHFETQLYRYYDIDVEIGNITYVDTEGSSQIFNTYCRSDELGDLILKVKAKVHNTAKVEDFYLFDPEINGWLQPTTTEEQQHER